MLHIEVGKYTLRNARGEGLFLSSISESREGVLKVDFYQTKRENAVTMAEEQANKICARLRAMDVQCYVVLAFEP